MTIVKDAEEAQEATTTPVCLVVEDEPAILRIIVLALREMGCEPVPVTSAEAALDALEDDSVEPSVIITDVRLPGMDGVELARRMKADERLSDRPVLLMSAYGEPRTHEGDAFLAKPFDIDEFGDFVTPYLEPAGT
jgi:CheY-like chemotaxis protein